MNDGYLAALHPLVITGIAFGLTFLVRAYIRAQQLQALWGKRLDALTPADWSRASQHLRPDEFDHVMRTRQNLRATKSEEPAPVLRDVIVQYYRK